MAMDKRTVLIGNDGGKLTVEIESLPRFVSRKLALEYARLSWDFVTRRNRYEAQDLTLRVCKGSLWRGYAKMSKDLSVVFTGSKYTRPRPFQNHQYKNMPERTVPHWQAWLLGLITHELWHHYASGTSHRAKELDCEEVQFEHIASVFKVSTQA